MNPNQPWYFLTADHIHWNQWTRKHRLKFLKRWLHQHHHPFRFYAAQDIFALSPPQDGSELIDVVLLQRDSPLNDFMKNQSQP